MESVQVVFTVEEILVMTLPVVDMMKELFERKQTNEVIASIVSLEHLANALNDTLTSEDFSMDEEGLKEERVMELDIMALASIAALGKSLISDDALSNDGLLIWHSILNKITMSADDEFNEIFNSIDVIDTDSDFIS